jgi:hypothetical protein
MLPSHFPPTTLSTSLSPALPRHPYQDTEFANRQSQIKSVARYVDEARGGDQFFELPAFLFYSVAGGGKSWLLARLHQRFTYIAPKPKDRLRGAVSALADLSEFYEHERWFTELAFSLLSQFIEQLKDTQPDIARRLGAARDKLKDESLILSRETVAELFVQALRGLSRDFVPVLLVDTIDKLADHDRPGFEWLEQYVLAPLTDSVLLIFASRREILRWQQFPVRRRLIPVQVEHFKGAETEEQFRKVGVPNFQDASRLLQPYANGHPYAAWYIRSQLDAARQSHKALTERELVKYKPELIQWLGAIEDWLLQDLDEQLRERLGFIATFRHFHIRPLKLLLADLERNDKLLQEGDSYFQNVIGLLVDTNLVRWSSQHHGYILDPTVRGIINRRLMLKDPAEFERQHRAALKCYEYWIENSPMNCGPQFIEAVYHKALLARVREKSPWSEIRSLTSRILVFDYFDGLEAITSLKEDIERDEELEKELGPGAYKNLQSAIQKLYRNILKQERLR